MPDDFITIEVKGLDKLIAGLNKFPQAIARNWSQAMHEIANDVILPERGLRNYPPETAANQPPTPFYIRGRGTQTASRNYGNSENLGKQWYTKREGFITRIGNRASYARYVHGDEQAKAMARIGWRKLFDVAKEKVPEIKRRVQLWIDYTIRSLGL